MAAVQSHPGSKHVTVEAAGVGAVTFLQNHYRVLNMAVHRVNPEVGARRLPPLAAPQCTPDGPDRYREEENI